MNFCFKYRNKYSVNNSKSNNNPSLLINKQLNKIIIQQSLRNQQGIEFLQ